MSPARIQHPERQGTDAYADLPTMLRSYMARNGMSQAALADYLGTDARTLGQWLAGRRPSKALYTALRLALSAGPAAEAMELFARGLDRLQAARQASQPGAALLAAAARRRAKQQTPGDGADGGATRKDALRRPAPEAGGDFKHAPSPLPDSLKSDYLTADKGDGTMPPAGEDQRQPPG